MSSAQGRRQKQSLARKACPGQQGALRSGAPPARGRERGKRAVRASPRRESEKE